MYSADVCLEDGIHLTQTGRERYASMLSNYIVNTIPGVSDYVGTTE